MQVHRASSDPVTYRTVKTPGGDMAEADRLAAEGWRIVWANVNERGECLSVIMERTPQAPLRMETKEHDNGA